MNSAEGTKIAAHAHTNLNIFASIVSILEGGCIYGCGTADDTAAKIIRLCQAEQQRQLRIYDRQQRLAAKS